ncbi:MAG: DinB family protein [Anaerolineales bacterium]|nr:DinB family protein [Anaerolineales bacterium]
MLDTLIHSLALAAQLEDEGQFNNAKLLRAACDSLLTRAARRHSLPVDKAGLLAETDRAIKALGALEVGDDLLTALRHARTAMAEGHLARFAETPDPFVCRTCGHLSLSAAANTCPICGAKAATFNRFRAIYWLEALDPFAALEHLRETPGKLADLLADVSDADAGQASEDLGWSLRQALTHLRDAQGVLDQRVDRILDYEDPVLESKAVFEWARNEAGQPPTLSGIFESYRASRAHTLARLEHLPLANW